MNARTSARRDVLDAAYDRLGQWGFDEPNGFVNHGPMVCEALDVLGRPAEVESWSHLDDGTPPVVPVEPRRFDPHDALGDASRTGEWMGHFARAIDDDGWATTLHRWLPVLLPGLGVALFHGAIRCAHAARAVESADTPSRRVELTRSLGYWAGLCTPGATPERGATDLGHEAHVGAALVARDAARTYLTRPNIIHLHGITAAMAVSILVRHVDEPTATLALAQLRGEHRALFERTPPTTVEAVPDILDTTLVDAAVASGEAHAVKLVEACHRGAVLTADPTFAAAAQRVVRRGLRRLDHPVGLAAT